MAHGKIRAKVELTLNAGDTLAALFPGGILFAPQGQDDFNAACDNEYGNDEEYEAYEKLHKNIRIDAVLKPVMQS